MDTASAGAMGWTTLNSGFAFAIGFLVCIILTLFIAKPLADKGKERYIFPVFMASLISVIAISFTILSRLHTDKAVFVVPDSQVVTK